MNKTTVGLIKIVECLESRGNQMTKDEVAFLKYAKDAGFCYISKEGKSNYVRIYREKVEINEEGIQVSDVHEQFCITKGFRELVKFKAYSIQDLLEQD